ncbi:hypothetical protein D3C85_683560 [compost metagenome]
MPVSTTMPNKAARENQATLPCPCGMMNSAASRGPRADPTLPPTWNSDCASPCRPPEAMRATRDDSGWKTDEPVPTRTAATSSQPNDGATDSSSRPSSVNPMPTGSEYGLG